MPLHLVTYYDDLGAAYPWAVQLPVAAVTLDFLGPPGAAVPSQTLALLQQHGFPADKRLGAGVVDGRSVWKDDGGWRLGPTHVRHIVRIYRLWDCVGLW